VKKKAPAPVSMNACPICGSPGKLEKVGLDFWRVVPEMPKRCAWGIPICVSGICPTQTRAIEQWNLMQAGI